MEGHLSRSRVVQFFFGEDEMTIFSFFFSLFNKMAEKKSLVYTVICLTVIVIFKRIHICEKRVQNDNFWGKIKEKGYKKLRGYTKKKLSFKRQKQITKLTKYHKKLLILR